MNKDPIIFIKQIESYIEKVQEYIHGVNFEDFENDEQLQDSVI